MTTYQGNFGHTGLLSAGTSLPSHRATWRDLVLFDETHLEPEFAPDLSPGWRDRWTATFRIGKSETCCSERDLTWTDLARTDPMRANTYHRTARSWGGLTYMESLGEHLQHQSTFEHHVLMSLDWGGLVAASSQPLVLSWQDRGTVRTHVPDVAVEFEEGITIINARPTALLSEKHHRQSAALDAVCTAHSWECCVITGFDPIPFKWLQYMAWARSASDPTGVAVEILEAVNNGPRTWSEVANGTSAPAVARSLLLALMHDRMLTVDMRQPLRNSTLVTLVPEDAR